MLRENGYWGSNPIGLKNRTSALLGMAMGSAKNTVIPDSPTPQ